MNAPYTFHLRLWQSNDEALTVAGWSPMHRRLRESLPYPAELPSSLRTELPRTPEQLRALAQQMGTLLLPGSIWTAFASARRKARQHGQALRICLEIGDPALISWPWEMAADPTGDFLALNHQTPFARCHPGNPPATRPSSPSAIQPSTHPLLLLADMRPDDAEPSGGPQTSARDALQPLLDADRLSADLCQRATPQRLQHALAGRNYSILHLIGEFASEEAQSLVDAISDRFRGFIILQTRSSDVEGPGEDLPTRLIHMLVEVGAAAALAVAAQLGPATGAFLRGLYTALATGHALDRAVTAARVAAARAVGANAWGWAWTVLLARDPGLCLWSVPGTASRTAALDRSSAPSADAGIRFAGPAYIAGDVVGGRQVKQVTRLGDVGVMRNSEVGTQKSSSEVPASASPSHLSEGGPSIYFEDEVHIGGDVVAGDQIKHETRTGDIGLVRSSRIGSEGDARENPGGESAAPPECPHCAAGREAGYRYCDKCGRLLG